MSILYFETDIHGKEEMAKLKRTLSKFCKTSVIINVPIEDFSDIFNEYLIETLDINLYDYDLSITENPFTINLDMSYVKDENLQEYEYIINELKTHFGKSIVRIDEDDENAMGIINIRAALRMIFSEASELEQKKDVIRIKINIEDINENSFEKYFLK